MYPPIPEKLCALDQLPLAEAEDEAAENCGDQDPADQPTADLTAFFFIWEAPCGAAGYLPAHGSSAQTRGLKNTAVGQTGRCTRDGEIVVRARTPGRRSPRRDKNTHCRRIITATQITSSTQGCQEDLSGLSSLHMEART